MIGAVTQSGLEVVSDYCNGNFLIAREVMALNDAVMTLTDITSYSKSDKRPNKKKRSVSASANHHHHRDWST